MEDPPDDVQVRDRAAQFEALIRQRFEFSFSRQSSGRRASSLLSSSSIELSDLATAPCGASSPGKEHGNSEKPRLERFPSLTRTISPLSRISSRRGEEALNSLITETSRLMTHPGASSHIQAETVAAMSDRLADIAHALSSKEEQVENLQAVLKELAETRAEAIQLKVNCLESYNKLQADYSRVIKSAQMAQQAARYNLSKAHSIRNSLRNVEDELHKAKATGASLSSCNQQLQKQNRELKARVAALEAMIATQPADCRHSVSQYVYQELSIMRNVGLY